MSYVSASTVLERRFADGLFPRRWAAQTGFHSPGNPPDGGLR